MGNDEPDEIPVSEPPVGPRIVALKRGILGTKKVRSGIARTLLGQWSPRRSGDQWVAPNVPIV